MGKIKLLPKPLIRDEFIISGEFVDHANSSIWKIHQSGEFVYQANLTWWRKKCDSLAILF